LEEILTTEQVASLLQIHPKTVYKFAQEGAIPGKKVGGIWRFSKEAIVKFVAGNEKKS
jgi:excisionase family DNA binding protein